MAPSESIDLIVIFIAVVGVSVFVDLVLHRDGKQISIRDAALWSVSWIGLALAFAGYLAWTRSPEMASLFLSGWALEKSLSLDNLMVFIAIFRAFWIPSGLQHRILYYGILGAVVFRLVFVAAGTSVLHLLGPWADIAFAGFVGYAAFQMLRGDGDDDEDPDYNQLLPVRIMRKFIPVVPKLDGLRFFVSRERLAELRAADPTLKVENPSAARYVTPALVCLLVIEWSDVMFSFDSVPVVIAVTHEPLLIYAAMIFAILGLRSLYFVIEVLTHRLVHLEKAVAALLVFITLKLFMHGLGSLTGWFHWELSAEWSMAIIGATLLVGVVASLLAKADAEPVPLPVPVIEGSPDDPARSEERSA